MNSERLEFSRWEKWGTVGFYIYCVSTIFMIFFSTSSVQTWPYPWNRVPILIACLIPLLLLFIWKTPEWINFKNLRKEFLLVSILVILAILNILFSENRFTTFKVMTLFIISGLAIFVVTSCFLTTKFRQTIFLWLCWVCLVVLCVYGVIEYINGKPILLLSYNPIPAGSLLILLFAGPFLLFPSSSWWLRFLELSSIVFAIAVIVMIGERGPILGLIVMAFLFSALMPGRKFWIVPLIVLILIGTGYKVRNHLPASLRRNLITHASTLFRLEGYPLAAHIFLKKPLFGIGLRPSMTKYLKDYRPKFTKDTRYWKYIEQKKTLENMILCGFVEMGGLFAITYITLIVYLLRNLIHSISNKSERRLQGVLILIPLGGFFIHSMTFDSLMFPHLNWIFHSFLGMMANFNQT